MVVNNLLALLTIIKNRHIQLDIGSFDVQLDDGWHDDSDIRTQDYIIDIPSRTIYLNRNIW